MITMKEIQQRAFSGQIMTADEFDVALTRKVRELVKKHGVKYNREELMIDDATADGVFNGAVDLLADIGLYHIETSRVIKWSKEEVLQIAREYFENPPSITFGKGKDETTIRPRKKTEAWRPVLWASGNPPLGDERYIPFIQAFARESVVEGISYLDPTVNAQLLGDDVPKVGTPSEITWGLWQVENTNEAIRRVGRPDMHLGLLPMVTSGGATMALLGPGKREKHNSMIGMHIMPEMRVDWGRLNAAVLSEVTGIPAWISAISLVGGLCGGPAGTSMGMIANYLAQLLYGRGKMGHIYAGDLPGRDSNRECLWTYNAAYGAIERHIGIAKGSFCAELAPVSSFEEGICRGVVLAISTTASGAAYSWAAGTSPLTCRIHSDVMAGVAGMEGEKVNKILQAVSTKIDEIEKAGAAAGTKVSWDEQLLPNTYDLKAIKPTSKYLDACKRSVEMLASCGVPISDRLDLS